MFSQRTDVTVVMRTKNCARVLDQTLKALFSQTFTAFELLVVDSSSTDGSLEIARQYDCKTMLVASEDYFPGKILNRAIAASHSEIIVFLNSDAVLLTPTALKNLLDVFEDDEVQAAFGRQVARPDAKTWVSHELIKSFPRTSKPPFWLHFALPFAAMRKTIWQTRPFYTKAWGSEDTEWGYWAKACGIRIKYVPKACVMHSHNYTLKQLYGRKFIEGEADAFIYKSSYSFWHMLAQMGKAIISDCFVYLRAKDIWGLFLFPIDRVVYFWAYYQGYLLGARRIKYGIQDSSIGQSEVLKRYDK